MSNEPGGAPGKVSSNDVRRGERGSSGGRRLAVVDGHEAEMTYSRASASLVIIDHTGVPGALRGRGVGQALVLRAVEDARRAGRFPSGTVTHRSQFGVAQAAGC